MKLTILQPVPGTRAMRQAYRDEVAVLGAVLRQRGHAVTLVLFDRFDESAVAAAILEAQPEIILIHVESLAADLAFRAAGAVAETRGAPLIPFGPHARLCPDECLSMTGAEAVAVGQADFAIPPYLESRGWSLDSPRAPGLWVKCETGVMRNPPRRPPATLADQPPPARDLYPPEHMLDPTGLAYGGVSRGGEDAGLEVAGTATPGAAWSAASWPARHRPVAACLQEMRLVTDEQLDIGGWRIGNERWASSPKWLAEFTERYRREIGLPFRTALYAPDVKDHGAALLARAGCEEVAINVGSASTFIRNEVLGLGISSETIVAAFDALRRVRVPTVARVEIGAPYETAVTLEETTALLKRLDPDRIEAVLHFPAPGSRACKIAKENGWLVPDPAAAHLAGLPAVAVPALSAEEIRAACELLPYVVHRPRIVPLLRFARRVKMGTRGTAYDLVVKGLIAPPRRRKRK
jgi:hypothetical protein